MVHLQQVWLVFAVKHDVEAKNLKAHRVLIVFNLVGLVLVCDVRLSDKDGLDYQIFHLIHQLFSVRVELLFEEAQYVFQRAFGAETICN